MKVIIIEDELPAQAKLAEMLKSIDASIEVVAILESVKDTLTWLKNNPEPELAFVDIQLSDDHSFEIFKQHPIKFPIVFTTAFDKYLLQSFEFNSIDYLLKPITEEKLRRSLDKVKTLQDHFVQGNLQKILNHIQAPQNNRILAKKGNEFVALNMNDIAYFDTQHKVVFATDFSGRRLMVDKTITELEQLVDESNFFRLNRKYLCALAAIEKFKSENGKINVQLQPETKETVYVSKENAPAFRDWIA
ncbi:LytTR family DNA-binding domain-containing protein [Marivirga atlantica]|jgi:DNA-binding LytR/AlgR family response regulator|uniref:Response regulator transcription factor n=1 Tax=Marivirga atlantica TaxID=1548457 RepID=A0A937AG33_9BACT|nr:LytTR family DNA-binding domain-containing protein [Marivirga atlantica]MBL0765839.1 response regulator transcription factor [Marivirga atlantica]